MLPRIFMVVVALALPRIARTDDDDDDGGGSDQCFRPNGSKDPNDVPCFANDTTSRCCVKDQFCSTNKLCVSKSDPSKLTRGTCLDQNFGSSCPTFCKGINDGGKVTVFQCGDPSLGTFCCDEGNGYSCCATPSLVLTLGVVTTFTEGSTESTIMAAMSNSPTTSGTTKSDTTKSDTTKSDTTKSKTTTSSSEAQPKSTQTATSVQIQTTVQTQTSVEAQTSVQTQTSIQVQTSAQIATSIQTQTSAQVVTSVQVQTSVIVVTSVAAQTSIQTQAPPPPPPPPSTSSLPTSTISQLPAITASSSQSPSTSIVQPTSILQSSTTILSTSETPTFSATAESIVQSSPTSALQPIITSPAVSSPALITSGTISPSKDSSIVAGAISATTSPTASGGTSTAAIVSGSVGGTIAFTIFIMLAVLYVRRRAQKRASARFEAALGGFPTFGDEKGSIRSGKSGNGLYGLPFGKFLSKEAETKRINISPPIVRGTDSPADTIGGSTIQATERGMTPSELLGDGNPYQRTSRGSRSSYSVYSSYWNPNAAKDPAESDIPQPAVQRGLTGDGSKFVSPLRMNSTNTIKPSIPERGLEKRISGESFEAPQAVDSAQGPGMPEVGGTFRSETFNKLLEDVQSQPF